MINLSLSKIRELHGAYKQICDTFSINLTEFETIFEEKRDTYNIWDIDDAGKSKLNQ